MAITEENRHRMYECLEEVLGREHTATLMEHRPPVGSTTSKRYARGTGGVRC